MLLFDDWRFFGGKAAKKNLNLSFSLKVVGTDYVHRFAAAKVSRSKPFILFPIRALDKAKSPVGRQRILLRVMEDGF